jgi:hypothetical protein
MFLQHFGSIQCPRDALEHRIGIAECIAGNAQRLEHALTVHLMLFPPEWQHIAVPGLCQVLLDGTAREMHAGHGAQQLETL